MSICLQTFILAENAWQPQQFKFKIEIKTLVQILINFTWNMDQKITLSSSSVLFLEKLKSFLDSIGISFDQFFNNFPTANKNQLSRLQFFRIVSLIHIETYNNFESQKAFAELSRQKDTIPLPDIKKLMNAVGVGYNERNEKRQKQQKLREDEMKKKVVRIGVYKLQQFITNHPNPVAYFHQFDVDQNNSISKAQFSKMLMATDIKQFASKQVRKMLVDHIFTYYPKGQMTILQLCAFFKIQYNKSQRREVSPLNKPHIQVKPQSNGFQKLNVPKQNPFQNHLFNQLDPFKNRNKEKKPSPMVRDNNQNNNLRVPSPKKQNQFHKKHEAPLLNPTVAAQKKEVTEVIDYLQNRISNFQNSYPLSMKYYRLGEPQPFEYQILEELEGLLAKGAKYQDRQNPRITEGSYVPSSNIFKAKYHIFQMASSVLMRQKSRIGIAQQIEPKDIIQGSVGDCYLLSSIASIISIYPQLIADRFLLNINPSNFYAIKLFIDGQWKIVTTDDRFPCKGSNIPLFAKPHTNQIWVMLLQKCWAKEFGSYKAIEAGSSKEGFMALTGAPCEIISQEKEGSQDQAIKQLEIAQKNRYVATMSGSTYLESLGKRGQEELGLIAGHAYSLLKIIKANGQNLVKLRNPWGKTIWKGDWSFQSKKWTKQLRDRYNYNRSPEDGSFYMNWPDFRKYFGEIVICKLNPTFMHDSIRAKTTRHKSGYFSMHVKTPGKYIVSIYQVNKRKMSQQYSNYEYSQARIIILKKQGNKMKYIGSKSTSQYQVCSADVDLEAGEYVISAKVVWKFWESSELTVTSYGTEHAEINPINRSIAPIFKQQMIKSYSTLFAGTGKVKSYEKYGFNATCETNFNLESGLGFIKMVNKSEKSFESVQQMDIKGLKLIKPDKLPLSFVMGPKSQKVYGFFVTPSGFEYSNTEKIKYY